MRIMRCVALTCAIALLLLPVPTSAAAQFHARFESPKVSDATKAALLARRDSPSVAARTADSLVYVAALLAQGIQEAQARTLAGTILALNDFKRSAVAAATDAAEPRGTFFSGATASIGTDQAYVAANLITGTILSRGNNSLRLTVVSAKAVAKAPEGQTPQTTAEQQTVTERLLSVLQNGGSTTAHLVGLAEKWHNDNRISTRGSFDVGVGGVSLLGSSDPTIGVVTFSAEGAVRAKLRDDRSASIGEAAFGLRSGYSRFTSVLSDPTGNRRSLAYLQVLLQVTGPGKLQFGITGNLVDNRAQQNIRRIQIFTDASF